MHGYRHKMPTNGKAGCLLNATELGGGSEIAPRPPFNLFQVMRALSASNATSLPERPLVHKRSVGSVCSMPE
jgi:hypothetical protein